MITVAEYIAFFLVQKEIKHIFGYQGSAILKIIHECIKTEKIQYIQNFHEQASSFAADAYGRCNQIGVVVATSGPGAINILSGIANAYFDSVPMLVITGQDSLASYNSKNKSRQGGFQDLDIVAMVKGITKYSAFINNPDRIRYELEKAYSLAVSGRKGPVLLDIPLDIQFSKIDADSLISFNCEEKNVVTDSYPIDEVYNKINKSRFPVIIVGGGVRSSQAENELLDFSRETNIPIVATLNGLDCCTDILGFAGIYGVSAANLALKKSDLILALGCRFAKQHLGKSRDLYNSSAEIIRVEIDEFEFSRDNIQYELPIVGDIKSFLQLLNNYKKLPDFSSWKNYLFEKKKQYYDDVCLVNSGVNPVFLMRYLNKNAPCKTIFISDVGQNQMWCAQAFENIKDYRLFNSSGLGAMGYSLPAAIGASYASNRPVITVSGDGGFQMNMQELNILALHKNNIKCIIFNNGVLGLMRGIQKKYYNNHFCGNTPQEFVCPNLSKLAEVYGLKYLLLKDNQDFSKLNIPLSDNSPWIIEVMIDKDAQAATRYDNEVLINE